MILLYFFVDVFVLNFIDVVSIIIYFINIDCLVYVSFCYCRNKKFEINKFIYLIYCKYCGIVFICGG